MKKHKVILAFSEDSVEFCSDKYRVFIEDFDRCVESRTCLGTHFSCLNCPFHTTEGDLYCSGSEGSPFSREEMVAIVEVKPELAPQNPVKLTMEKRHHSEIDMIEGIKPFDPTKISVDMERTYTLLQLEANNTYLSDMGSLVRVVGGGGFEDFHDGEWQPIVMNAVWCRSVFHRVNKTVKSMSKDVWVVADKRTGEFISLNFEDTACLDNEIGIRGEVVYRFEEPLFGSK